MHDEGVRYFCFAITGDKMYLTKEEWGKFKWFMIIMIPCNIAINSFLLYCLYLKVTL